MSLYAFGSNGAGQLGVGHTDDLRLPARCLFVHEHGDTRYQGGNARNDDTDDHPDGDEVVAIAAGGNHTLVLRSSGKVYAAGSNANGRCAHDAGTVESLLRFSRVVIYDDSDEIHHESAESSYAGKGRRVDRFSAVSATWEASFLVDAVTSRLYVVGSGSKGELGLGEERMTTDSRGALPIPSFPPTGTKITRICSSGWHTVAVLSNGNVYGWGNARKGQLGNPGVQAKLYWSPTRIGDISFPVREAACGREFTVLTADPEDGRVAILGSDKWGIQSAAPASIKGYSSVSASWHGIYVYNNDGSLVSWGRNDRGQLPPSNMLHPRSLAVGSEHTIAVLDPPKLVACGWGEHGNCGPETDAQGNVAGRWAEVPLDLTKGQSVVAVGGGCATSWIVIR